MVFTLPQLPASSETMSPHWSTLTTMSTGLVGQAAGWAAAEPDSTDAELDEDDPLVELELQATKPNGMTRTATAASGAW